MAEKKASTPKGYKLLYWVGRDGARSAGLRCDLRYGEQYKVSARCEKHPNWSVTKPKKVEEKVDG